jgi:glycogen operon protein
MRHESLLLDPFARCVTGELTWNDATFGRGGDSAPSMPRGHVAALHRASQRPIRRPWADTVVYEAHVRSLTMRHPGIPEAQRGTYAALGHPAITEHLLRLGVTAIELLPISFAVDEPHLQAAGRRNVWGYSTLVAGAPSPRYAAGDDVGAAPRELRGAIDALHAAGIEVILDIVLNHTAEGGLDGGVLSMRGLADRQFYRQAGGRPVDWTGCGNTVDFGQPLARCWARSIVRRWVVEYGVDGFRLDLGATLGRGVSGEFTGEFLQTMVMDPEMEGVKWMAEPWDLGPGGYRLGELPDGVFEWNDRFRDTARRFVRGDRGQLGDLATRLAGSSDRFARPRSVHYAACHDGFTLLDLVSYERKRNLPNGEGNRDGRDDNASCAWGREGEAADGAQRAIRDRARRILLALSFLAHGVPMVQAGDELARTQRGNNNAYCQDGPQVWLDWARGEGPEWLVDWVATLGRLRAALPLGKRWEALTPEEVTWMRPDGAPMAEGDWADPERRALVMRCVDPGGDWLILLNGGREPQGFEWPGEATLLLDAGDPDAALRSGTRCLLPGPGLAVMRLCQVRGGGTPRAT